MRGRKADFARHSKYSASYIGRVLDGKQPANDRFLSAAARWLTVTDVSRGTSEGPSGAHGGEQAGDLSQGGPGGPPKPSPTPGLETPGERLRWTRRALGYDSQRAFAAALGERNRAVIGNFEGGRGAPERLLLKIEKIMGVSAEWLETGQGAWRIGPASLDLGALEQRIMAGLEPILHTLGMERGAALAALRSVLMSDRPEGSQDWGPEELGEYFLRRFMEETGFPVPGPVEKDQAAEEGAVYAAAPAGGASQAYDPVKLMTRIDALPDAGRAEVLAAVARIEGTAKSKVKAKGKKKRGR